MSVALHTQAYVDHGKRLAQKGTVIENLAGWVDFFQIPSALGSL